MQPGMTRRTAVRAASVCGGAAFLGRTGTLVERLLAQPLCDPTLPLGELLGSIPLHGDRARTTPYGRMLGGPGLDARLFTDLSKLEREEMVTPTAEMFVRTAAPPALRVTAPTWSIVRRGFGGPAAAISIAQLRRDAKPMGAHLIECSGNVNPDNFGLMSVTEWDGVPLAGLVSQLRERELQRGGASAVLVGGIDDTAQNSSSSTPGASWVFPLDTLERLGVFLAVRMNGEPLTPDHGAPVRLVVPGWYGCAWIKWVNEIALVGADEPATSQMLEFSTRTHQGQMPKLARDYEAPLIDLAATPIRVEKRRVNGRIEYRVIGIVWGGEKPADRLTIRFNAAEQPQTFAICPPPRTHHTWSLWEYWWRPASPGVYNIALRAADPTIRTRRLDLSFYVRRVIIDEV